MPISKGGSVVFKKAEIMKRHTFLDYVLGGCEINLSVAIDYTLSNKDPRDPKSLHCADLSRNQYYQALTSVGQICIYYDHSKRVPLLGFGGAIPPYLSQPSHCFALNGDIFNPYANGLGDVLSLYQRSLERVSLYGPTHMSEILGLINQMAANEEVSQ